MPFSPLSFLYGIGAAVAIPVVARVFRPLAVELVAAGLALTTDARRIAAEQLEAAQDLVAEARARFEERVLADDTLPDDVPDASEPLTGAGAAAGRGRRGDAGGGGERES